MNTILRTFQESLPSKPWCTDDLCKGLRVMPRDIAIRKKYIQFNGKLIGWMAFDIDRDGAAFAAEDCGLPEPTLAIINPENAHAHLLYRLRAPIATGGNARRSPQDYFKVIKNAYRERLGADPGYAGLIVKNPLCSAWKLAANDVKYDLVELADYINLSGIIKNAHLSPEFNESYRNCSIFDEARKWSYREVYRFSSHDAFYRAVELHCDALNSVFTKKLPIKEVQSIAKSIAKYCWLHKDQGLLISKDVCKRIESVCKQLQPDIHVNDVCKFAQAQVAKLASVDTRTIRRYLQNRAR